jgi:small subunit ribosomal protein S17
MKLIGKIVSDKAQKSRLVEITKLHRHPIYQKGFKVTRKILAHDEENTYKIGDVVEIASTRPISKNKAWKIVKKVG